MASTARWLELELGQCLFFLANGCGFEVVLVGHSLGAGVAALLAALLRPKLPRLRCYGFATPSVAAGER
jgi:pimeloyl-ACP methyl ester carboxylesterase